MRILDFRFWILDWERQARKTLHTKRLNLALWGQPASVQRNLRPQAIRTGKAAIRLRLCQWHQAWSCSRLVFSFAMIASTLCFSGEKQKDLPNGEAIQKALERGRAVRTKTQLVVNALFRTAAIIKVDGVRCGHALISIDDAKGVNGATYRLEENYKAAEGIENTIVSSTSRLWLNADLSLMQGQINSVLETTSQAGVKRRQTVSSLLTVRNGELTVVREEQRDNGASVIQPAEPMPLNGVAPLPRRAVLALAAFAAVDEGFKPTSAPPLCVPVLDVKWEVQSLDVEPTWLTFESPSRRTKNAEFQMKIRALSGRLGPTGLQVDVPFEGQWENALTWIFDARQKPIEQPQADGGEVEIETVEAVTLDVDAPFDMEKLRRVTEKIAPKKRK